MASLSTSRNGQAQPDARAIELATEALTKVDALVIDQRDLQNDTRQLREENRRQHEEGRDELRLIARRLHDRLDDLELRFNTRQLKAAGMVIVLLLGVLGYLVTEGPPWA